MADGNPAQPVSSENASTAHAPPAAERSYSAVVATGFAWSAIARLLLQVFQIISSAVVARRLDPGAYGLINMASIIIGFLVILRDLGVASAVVQRREVDDKFLSSIFWTNLALGTLGALACYGLGPVTAAFYRQPEIEPIMAVLSVSLVITNVASVHMSLLNRRLEFARLAVGEVLAAAGALAVAIVLAYSGYGVWSLVYASITNSTIGSVVLIALGRWRPKFFFSWREVRSVSRFSLNFAAFNLVNYGARNADNMLVGKYVGAAPLGYYQFAYLLMLYPVQNIAQLLGRVLFPVFSQMQDDNARLRHAYLRACSAIAVITIPGMIGLALVSDLFIRVLLGEKWAPVAPLLAILAPVGMLQSLTTTVGQIYTAKGRTDLMFRWGSLFSVIIVLGFCVGLPWGIRGVAITYGVVTALLAVPMLRIPFSLIGLSLKDFVRALRPIVWPVIPMALTVTALRIVIAPHNWPDWLALLVVVAAGAAVYVALLVFSRPPVLDDVVQTGRTMLHRFRSS